MPQPRVSIVQTNGGLGRVAARLDGVAALVVSGNVPAGSPFALGQFLTIFGTDDARALGLNEAYDTTNQIAVFSRIQNFYRSAGEGAELHLMVVARTETLTTMATVGAGFADALITARGGRIRLLAIARNPLPGFVPVVTSGIDSDVATAITAAQALRVSQAAAYRYVQILIEGRSFQGNAALVPDLRSSLNVADRVSVFVGADAAQSVLTPGYAAVTAVLGRLAADPVMRNPGRVKSGPMRDIVNASFSGGQALNTLTAPQLDTLHDKGYLFFRQMAGKPGFFVCNDWTATSSTSDSSRIARCRVIDKASRIAVDVYTNELLDELVIDPITGRLAASQVKSFQSVCERDIALQMRGEISRAQVFVDADQNVLSTDSTTVEISVIPYGTNNNITARLAFANPAI